MQEDINEKVEKLRNLESKNTDLKMKIKYTENLVKKFMNDISNQIDLPYGFKDGIGLKLKSKASKGKIKSKYILD